MRQVNYREVVVALRYIKLYEEVTPEVGMGPFLRTLAAKALVECGYTTTPEREAKLMDIYNQRYGGDK